MATALVDRHLHPGRGDRVAVYYGDQQLTYWNLAALINRTGNGLRSLGIAREDPRRAPAPRPPEFIATFLGAMKIGAVRAGKHAGDPGNLAYYLNDSRARAVVLTEECLERVATQRSRLPHLRHVVLLGDPQPNTESFAALVGNQSVELEAAHEPRRCLLLAL